MTSATESFKLIAYVERYLLETSLGETTSPVSSRLNSHIARGRGIEGQFISPQGINKF